MSGASRRLLRKCPSERTIRMNSWADLKAKDAKKQLWEFAKQIPTFYLRDLKKWPEAPSSAPGEERSDRKKWPVVRNPRRNSSSSLGSSKSDADDGEDRKIRCKSWEPRSVRKKWLERSARIKWSSLAAPLLFKDLKKWPEIIQYDSIIQYSK